MPAWPAIAPRAGPEWLAWLGRFPEREVSRVLLALIHLEARAGQHILQIAPRKLAVVRVGCYAKVDIAAGCVSVVALDQVGDEADDLGHCLGGTRVSLGRQDVERLQLIEELGHIRFGQL